MSARCRRVPVVLETITLRARTTRARINTPVRDSGGSLWICRRAQHGGGRRAYYLWLPDFRRQCQWLRRHEAHPEDESTLPGHDDAGTSAARCLQLFAGT